MGPFWRAMAGSFIGRILAYLFVAICVALGVGPNEWARFMIAELPTWVTPIVARIVFFLLAASTLFFLVRDHRRGAYREPTQATPLRKDRADIEIRFGPEPRYCVPHNGKYRSFRFGIYNADQRSEATNAEVWLVSATKPRAHVRYELPFQVARDGSEWTITTYSQGAPSSIPLAPVSINPKEEKFFEPLRAWVSSDGRYMVGRIDTKSGGDRYCWPIEADETWTLKYEARAANADTATIEVRVYVANGAVCVEKITG